MALHNIIQLTARLRENDVDAFNALYWHYHGALYANVLKLTKDKQATEDIVQEVFTALWSKRHCLDETREPGGWLFLTSYNKSVNYLKRKLKESLVRKEIGNQLYKQEITKEKNNTPEYRLDGIEEAIERLSPQKRKVFELCKIRGKTYEEAARELHISKYTVKEYLSGAVVFIRDYVKKHPEEILFWVIVLAGPGFRFLFSICNY